jgi:hypothetical protein
VNDVQITVHGNPDPAGLGQAIIRLTGVALVPPGSIVRIEPIADDVPASDPEDWPSPDLKPLEARITADGVDLVVGAEVVEAPALLPGTPVAISVPSVGARAEVHWPAMALAPARRGAAVVMSGAQRAAELAARSEADRLAALEAAEAARREADAIGESQRRASEAALRLAEESALSRLTLPGEPEPDRRNTVGSDDDAPPVAPPLSGLLGGSAALPPPSLPLPRLPDATQGVASKAPRPAPAKRPSLRSPSAAAAAPVDELARRGELAPAVRAPRPPRRSMGSLVFAFLLGAAVTVGAVAGWLQNEKRRFATAPIPPVPSAPAAGLSNVETATRPDMLALLAVPARSPLGRPADGVTFEDALRRADQALYGEGVGRNRDEASYWLRTAISRGLSEPRLLWAMTQLGAAFATPDGGQPDYATARLLWAVAGGAGDPVALCFLASASESGLGAPVDAATALSLYEQAKARGGCRDVDQSISRLKGSRP